MLDSAINLALSVVGVSGMSKPKVSKVDEQQLTLLQQHEAITVAARKLLDIAEDIYRDFESCPTWDDVDKYWKATEVADAVTKNL